MKVLLKEFFEQFLVCFFPLWASRFDFIEIDWQDKEVFLAPPDGEARELDLVAKLHLREGAPAIREGERNPVALVHVDLESRESAQGLRPRMFEYYVQFRRERNLPVLPISVFLRVGMDGIGWDHYEEQFWEHSLLRFNYACVGLPALDAEKDALGENLIGVALSTLMKVPAERKAELYAEGLKSVALAKENDFRRFLLTECLEAYSALSSEEKESLQKLLDTDQYKEIKPLMITTYERGILQGERQTTLRLLQAKFDKLTEEVKQRVGEMTPDQLLQLQINLLKAQTLKDLGLED